MSSAGARGGGSAAEARSDPYRRREDPSAEQHGGARAEDQRAGQPNGRISPRGKEDSVRGSERE